MLLNLYVTDLNKRYELLNNFLHALDIIQIFYIFYMH
jgi:hypothetical protein